MKIFLFTLTSLLGFVLLSSIGFIIAKKTLKGSCGGLGKIMGDNCMFCEKKEECDSKKKTKTAKA